MRVRLGKCFVLLISLIVLTVHAGCGESTSSTEATGVTPNEGLVDLHRMLKELGEANRPIPKNLAELAPIDPGYPMASPFLQNGIITYFWGTPLNPSAPNAATTIIAYETKAETDGGFVLLQDGTVKEMTKEEFAAAPKAGTKTKKK